jgi:GMP synthase-like glutamine amidotransferase
MRTCLVVQHVEPEGPYSFGEALDTQGITLDIRRVFAGDPLPSDASGIEGLLIMGGPMSARVDEGFATRATELALLTDALKRCVPTLGVCLGAQLLAHAGGGVVSVGNAGPEIGWESIELTPEAASDPLLEGLPDHLTVLHWHGETFTLPPEATHLAASIRYPNQAFRLGECAWGLQFHLEVTALAVDAFLAAFGQEAKAAGTDPETIRQAAPGALADLAPLRNLVTHRFAALVEEFARVTR